MKDLGAGFYFLLRRQFNPSEFHFTGQTFNSEFELQPPKVISPTDPCSAWTAKANKRVQFGYGLNYMIDVEHVVIIDVEATPARTYDEVAATRTMIDRTEKAFGGKPERPPIQPMEPVGCLSGLGQGHYTAHSRMGEVPTN